MGAKSWRAGVVVLVTLGVAYGCGGDSGVTIGGDDGGADVTASDGHGGDVTAGEGGGEAAADGAAGGDATTDASGDAAPDAPKEASLDASEAGDDAGDGGGCQVDSDCTPQGWICGLLTPGVCSPCATDQDCKNDSDYGGKGLTLCHLPQGTCEQPSCAVADGVPCPQNPADVCCSQSCSTGNCCDDTQCSGTTPACQKHTCVACDAVAGGAYYVDPNNGSDALDGSGQAGGKLAPGCAFRTLTHALAVIGSPLAATTVTVLGPSSLSAGETFPFHVPANTRITNQGSLVTVLVPATVATADGGTSPGVGFDVTAPGVALNGLTIDGQANGSVNGVRVGTGGAATLSLLDVKNFRAGGGLRVDGTGALTVSCGVFSTDNLRGLHVTDQATATASCTNATILFNRNTGAGILVDTRGVLTVTGVAQSGGAGSVQASGNAVGLSMSADWTVAQPAASSIDGLVAWQNTTGASLLGGTIATIRRSQFLGGTIGVDIEPGAAVSAWQNATAGIDMGTTAGGAGMGGNTFQQPATADGGVNPHNTGIGVCYGVPAVATQTLDAAGDTWSNAAGTASLDCSVVTGTLTRSSTCTGGGDLGGAGTTTGTNTIDVAGCN
ncbi:MAG TPA: hypothetical protein VIF15_15875 [Polyangiaceae bacterium]